jgi:hypothetical protein
VNAERLHAVAKAVKDEMDRQETASLVQQVTQNLQQSMNEPNDPSHAQRVGDARTALNERLANSPSNSFSPAWREALDELGIADLVGEPLRSRIEQIFDRNEITPSVAVQEMGPISERVQTLSTALAEIDSSFGYLGIGAEQLEPGEFEIGFLIPRRAVHNDLKELGVEFSELSRILGPFLEITTGSRGDVRVRSISSSAFGAFLESAPATALVVAGVLERLISAYGKVLEIRLAHQQLKEAKAKEKLLEDVAAEAETPMAAEIDSIASDLLADASDVEEGRRNELVKELTMSINALANRIDRGYTVEVRAPELPPPPEEDGNGDGEAGETPEQRGLRETTEAVLAKQETLKFSNATGETILSLPEGDHAGTKPTSTP